MKGYILLNTDDNKEILVTLDIYDSDLDRNDIKDYMHAKYTAKKANVLLMLDTFNKEYYKGLKMNGKVFSLRPSKILLNPYGITAVIDTNASLKLTLTGI